MTLGKSVILVGGVRAFKGFNAPAETARTL